MDRKSRRVGVRELRQNLSVYLARVVRGEQLEVTDRGRPVAILAPLPNASSSLEKLEALGRLVPPDGDLLELGAPRGRRSSRLREALEEERAERL